MGWHGHGRRPCPWLCLLFGVLSACGDSSTAVDSSHPGDAGCSSDGSSRQLVVVTLNTHSFQEGADSLQKLASTGQGLAALDADLVGLNEVMSGTFKAYHYGGAKHDGTALVKRALEQASGTTYHALAVPFAHWSTGEVMSNVVLSRFPIERSDSRALSTTDFWPAPAEQRNVVFVRVRVPGLGPVALFVTHAWGWSSVDTAAQIAEVKAFIAQRSVGDEVLRLLVGDLNTPSTWPAYTTWLGQPLPLTDTFAAANPGSAVSSTTFAGEHRIDYILADRAGRSLTSRLVFDGTKVGGVTLPQVSDHKGVMTRFTLGRPGCGH